MHDTVGVVNGHGPILTETPPLEGRAERADLDLLVLLLPGKFHKYLHAGVQNTPRLALRLFVTNNREEERICPTCSKVDWEKLYSSKLKVRLAEDTET